VESLRAEWERPAEAPGGEQYLAFTLAGVEYAVALRGVREVDYPPPVTPLPCVPEWVLGVCNLRGDIVSVVDLRGFLGLEGNSPGAPGRLLVVQSPEDDVAAGLLVDGVRDIFRLNPDDVTPPEGDSPEPARAYLNGLARHAGRSLRVLDLGQMLRSPPMRQFEPA
jgi:purine-binding chemotaxis protein CheW